MRQVHLLAAHTPYCDGAVHQTIASAKPFLVRDCILVRLLVTSGAGRMKRRMGQQRRMRRSLERKMRALKLSLHQQRQVLTVGSYGLNPADMRTDMTTGIQHKSAGQNA